jgi:hypothetical protein
MALSAMLYLVDWDEVDADWLTLVEETDAWLEDES